MKKVPDPQDGQPTSDMPEVNNRAARRGHYSRLVARDPEVYEFDTAAGVTPEEAVRRPIRRKVGASRPRPGSTAASAPSNGAPSPASRPRIPYVIDNKTHRLADVLSEILAGHTGKSFDVATAYFNVQGFRLLQQGLLALGSFRLLLGDEPSEAAQVGLRPRAAAALLGELSAAVYSEELLGAVEELIAFLRRPNVAVRAYQGGFLHAKAYLFYGDRPTAGWDRFRPVAAIVGSSNLTGSGLTTNRELNLAHKAVLDEEDLFDDLPAELWPEKQKLEETFAERDRKLIWKASVGARAIADLDAWFERQWAVSRDFKDELIELLDASKFGTKEYTPYQIYMKALFEYFRDDLGQDVGTAATRSAVDLAEFQEDAVRKARKILARYDGVLIGDSVGLGKTWIGKKLLEDHAYHLRQKALVICPASLREMWQAELREVTIPATILSQEELGQADFAPAPYGDADVLLIDESHNFRNKAAQRYENLERLINLNGGRGRDGQRKKVILLTATPINNDIFDLYHQLSLFTRGDRSYFAAAGIGDLQRYFINARRDSHNGQSGVALFNLLEEVVIRRTRPFIRRAYPNATILGQPVHWPERRLRTIDYNLEATYGGIYDRLVDAVDGLRLAPYRLESFKKQGIERDEFEEGREEALAGIFKSRYLKRFESSVEAFRISVRRALEFFKTFESYVLDGRVLDSASFHRAMRYLEREDIEDDATPRSLGDELDAHAEARDFLATLPTLDASQYDLRRLHDALQHDIDALTEIWHEIKDLTPERDAKVLRLRELLSNDLRGQKVLLFTYYKDTARYLYRELGGERGEAWRAGVGDPHIRRMDSGAPTRERSRLIEAFAPRANGQPELADTPAEVDILVSTDVLSEGQNLQDCGVVVNYDLHWNPTRMVQRAGRVDRLLSPHDRVTAPSPRGGGRQHFWHYYDLHDNRVHDNRFVIANLIACAPDTPPVVGDVDVFAIQERVIEHILARSQEQRAIEEAPKILDPIQQTVATLLRSYLNHPEVDRQEARRLVQALSAPLPSVHVRALRTAYQEFGRTQDVVRLIATLQGLPLTDDATAPDGHEAAAPIKPEDLHLVCFDFVWS